MPYTYLIGWSDHHKYYYGCRYAKHAQPDDLWVTYFTSSKLVKCLRCNIGEPDIIQIRKVFSSAEECIEYEKRVIRRVVRRPHFINRNVAGAIIGGNPSPRSDQQREVARSLMRNLSEGSWYTDGVKIKRFKKGEAPHGWVIGTTPEYKKKISATLSALYQNKVWFNDGHRRRKYPVDGAPDGWVRGWVIKIINIEI